MMAKFVVRVLILACVCAAAGCEMTDNGLRVLPNTESSWNLLGLKRMWAARASDARVKNAWIVDRFLIVETSEHVLDVFDRRAGRFLFPLEVGRPVVGRPVFVVDKEHVERPIELLYVIATSKLYEVRLESQSVERVLDLRFPPSTSPAVGFLRIFIGSDSGRLCVIDRREWYYSTGRSVGSAIHSELAMGDNAVFFGANDGIVYGVQRSGQEIVRRFQTDAPVTAGVIREDHTLYVASQDFNVYAIPEVQPAAKRAAFKWKVSLESIITDTPVSEGDRLYVKTVSKGMFVLNKADGEHVWALPDGEQILAFGKKNAYVLLSGKRPRIAVVDLETGEKKEELDVSGYRLFVTNTEDAVLYLLDQHGGMLALAEREGADKIAGEGEQD